MVGILPKVCMYHWQRWHHREAAAEKQVEKIAQHFRPASPPQTLVMNQFLFAAFLLTMLSLVDFPARFKVWCVWAIVLPHMLVSLAYYAYKFGPIAFELTGTVLTNYLLNFLNIVEVSLLGHAFFFILYIVLLYVERLLPTRWQGVPCAPFESFERSIRAHNLLFWIVGVLLLLSAPLWRRAHQIGMEAVGRKSLLTLPECCAEIVYHSSQNAINLAWVLVVALKAQHGFPLHAIHVAWGVAEMVLFCYTLGLSFEVHHNLEHKIQPWYMMSHYEHHVTRSIYPTSAGYAPFEMFTMGYAMPSPFGGTACTQIPGLQVLHWVNSITIHFPMPSKKWLQWHHLHHLVAADVYSASVPSSYDQEHSKDLQKYEKSLIEAGCTFIEKPALIDVVHALLLLPIVAVYACLGTGPWFEWGLVTLRQVSGPFWF